MHAEYLLLLGGCVLITLPLELVVGARVYRRPRAIAAALVPVIAVFGAWDLLGIHRGHWWYEPSRISGITLPGYVPLEELLFFVVIPLCGLLTFEAVRRLLDLARRARDRARRRHREARAARDEPAAAAGGRHA